MCGQSERPACSASDWPGRCSQLSAISLHRLPGICHKKPQLVARVRTAQQQHQVALVEASVKREARIAELEARLEPYRTIVEHVRARMQQEEQGRFGDLPLSR